MKTYLNVPYASKDEARRKGARWDPVSKKWYIENVDDVLPFMKWLPEYLKVPYGSRPKNRTKTVDPGSPFDDT